MNTIPQEKPHLDYTICEILVEEIVEIVKGYMNTEQDIEKIIRDTYIFARDAHEGQLRKSGEPYITHPLQAVKILLTLKPDLVSIQSCILHDVIEDTTQTKADIEERFGYDVAVICE